MNECETLEARRKYIGGSCTLFFEKSPLKIVKGSGQFIFDENGKKYLDCVNNVSHVGHSHPDTVAAASRQMTLLNTNTRYLHDTVIELAKRIVATLPDPLSVCYFVNSGSEANDLALRLSRAYTGAKDVIVLDHAYHGQISSMYDISPYKFNRPCSLTKQKKWVHVSPNPDTYRGVYRDSEFAPGQDLGQLYAAEVQRTIDGATAAGRRIAAFFHESAQSCAGQVVFPKSFLRHAYGIARQAGALCVADEVQVGFGRVGAPNFWFFQHYGADVVPDIVTLGKPMGNGHPISAVVTTPVIAARFQQVEPSFFATFGGNPVSCAIACSVLDVLERERLAENAAQVGEFLLGSLRGMQPQFPIMGAIRGVGLFIGIDFVSEAHARTPASKEAEIILYKLLDRGIIVSLDGPHSNVLKLKPPMCFSRTDAEFFLRHLIEVLIEVSNNPPSGSLLNVPEAKRRWGSVESILRDASALSIGMSDDTGASPEVTRNSSQVDMLLDQITPPPVFGRRWDPGLLSDTDGEAASSRRESRDMGVVISPPSPHS